MSRARAKKILLCLERTPDADDTNNPDSILFMNNQFPQSYDSECNTSENSNLMPTSPFAFSDNFEEYVNQHNTDETTFQKTFILPINNSSILNLSGNESNECIIFSTDEIPTTSFNNSVTEFQLVENVIIEEGPEPIVQSVVSPSVLSNDFESPCVIENDENFSIEPAENSLLQSSDNSMSNVPFQRLTTPNHNIQVNLVPEVVSKLVDYTDSDSEPEEPKPKRKKRCQVKKDEWTSEINKKNREMGKEYKGKRKVNGIWVKDLKRPKKVMKSRCNCVERKNNIIKCHSVSEDDRKLMFNKFWNMTWDEKRVLVQNLVKILHTSRPRDRKDPEKSKRSNTLVYYLKKEEEMIRVCKTMFLNTLSIGKTCVWSWKVEELPQASTNEIQPIQTIRKPFEAENKSLIEFLNDLPKMPSHYCRKRTSFLYLQPDIASKRQLYDLYVEHCKTLNVKALSVATFTNSLVINKISLYKPKKDLCETCNGHKLGHISDEVYTEHTTKKNEARLEKEFDKANKDFVFTADLQAVLLAPRSNVSSNYYKTKLCVHNWCIYDMKTTDGYCFIWNESEGGLNSDEFATISSNFLVEKVIPKMDDTNREIILYSDGCTYQNRNAILSNALTNLAILHNITITQKYLEVGHTQMEVDSMHAMIEKKLKNQTINVPAEYITICRKAKKNKPYEVKYLNYPYFKSFKELNFYKSIRPGKMKGDAKVFKVYLVSCLLVQTDWLQRYLLLIQAFRFRE